MKHKLTAKYNLCSPLPAILYLLNPTPLFAADDDELFFEIPVVLSGNRLEQSVADAAVSISVIDRETIEISGARTIPEVLRLIPGMQVGYSGNEFGDEPQYVVAYHGHSDQFSKQMQVLIDGRSIYNPFFGGINWKAIPVNINDIERIEVSRGPNVATYGSNSFQAAINIITRTAAEDQGSFIQTNLGNNETADLTYRYGGSSGDLDYRVTLMTFNDAGLDSANEFDYPDDVHSNNIDYRLDYQIDNKNTLSYQGGYGRKRQQTDRNYSGFFPLARTTENTNIFQFLKWENAINHENTLLVQYYYNLADKNNFSQSDLIVFSPLPLDSFTLDVNAEIKSERHNLELSHIIYPNKSLKIIWGLSAQADLVRAPLYLGTNKTISQNLYRGFANIEWHINSDNIFNIGALVEKNDVTITELSPRVSFTHTFTPQHSIRFAINTASRSPFIYEAKGDLSFSQDLTINGTPASAPFPEKLINQQLLGSTELDNEKILSREIVYFGNYIGATLSFKARLFNDDISGAIDTARHTVDPATGDNVPDDLSELGNPAAKNIVRVYENGAGSSITGLELELDYRIDPTLRLIANGAIVNIKSRSNPTVNSAPQHSFSFITNKQFNKKFNASLAYYYAESFKWTDSRGGVDDYETLDIRLSRNLKFNHANGSLSFVIKNLLDDYSDYQENPSSSIAPKVVHSTLAYLDLRLNF